MPGSERKRIVFLIDSLGMGGAERLLIPILKHLDTGRFSPYVCALQIRDGNPIADDIRALGVRVDVLPVRRLRDPLNVARFVRYLRETQADLVHTQLEFANTLGGPAAKWLKLPVVCTLHTLFDPTWGVKSYFRHLAMWWSLRTFFDRVIAVSESTRLHHIKKGLLDPSKVLTLYNGIDLTGFSAIDASERACLRRELGIPATSPLLITVAVLRPQKGIQYMLDALPQILDAIPKATYLIVGDGEHRSLLEQQAQAIGVHNRVAFAGVRKDIPALLAASDVFVLPSLGEALPTVLAEAMAARKPIIATAVGGMPEMVQDTENGILVPSCDPEALARACIRLLSDGSLARRLGERGREIVEERFNVRCQAQQLGELYDKLLSTRSAGKPQT